MTITRKEIAQAREYWDERAELLEARSWVTAEGVEAVDVRFRQVWLKVPPSALMPQIEANIAAIDAWLTEHGFALEPGQVD